MKKMFMEKYKDSASFVLRLFLGLGFLSAGLHKLTHVSGVTTMFADMLGFGGAAAAMVWLAIVIELVGGICLLVGYQTRWAASILAVLILVATFKTFGVTADADFFTVLKDIFVMGPANTSTNLMYLAGLLALAMGGSEKLAVKPE